MTDFGRSCSHGCEGCSHAELANLQSHLTEGLMRALGQAAPENAAGALGC